MRGNVTEGWIITSAIFDLFTKQYVLEQMKGYVMDGEYSTHERLDKYIQHLFR